MRKKVSGMIRKALDSDLSAITAIYNQAIDARCCTGDTVCLNVDERLSWFEQCSNPKTPIFVYETEEGVIGYSYISSYRPGRGAFEGIGEVSYYVDFNHHGKGIGSLLLEHLILEARKIGYAHLIAILLDCNAKSVSLLEKNGFCCWGKMPDIARIDENCFSHLYYGVSL